jgi:hypothetical protein
VNALLRSDIENRMRPNPRVIRLTHQAKLYRVVVSCNARCLTEHAILHRADPEPYCSSGPLAKYPDCARLRSYAPL